MTPVPPEDIPTPEEFEDADARFEKARQNAMAAVAAMSRAGRRAAGFRGPLYHRGGGRNYFVPRYIRRHYDADAFRLGNTRRQRRVRARITRLVAQKGLGVSL